MKPLARKNQLVVEELVNECVVYDCNQKKGHSLNPTVTWIWRHCDGATDVTEMASQLERKFHCADALDVVSSAIQQLDAADLLQVNPLEDKSRESVMSRRSVVAAGSALMPGITSILVPTTAMARSKPDKLYKH